MGSPRNPDPAPTPTPQKGPAPYSDPVITVGPPQPPVPSTSTYPTTQPGVWSDAICKVTQCGGRYRFVILVAGQLVFERWYTWGELTEAAVDVTNEIKGRLRFAPVSPTGEPHA